MKQRCVLVLVLGAVLAAAQAPDNSKTNQRDRYDRSATADQQQKMSKADTDLVRKIRQSVIADKTLSTYAHNVKIVAQDGQVTLRGPVRNDAERDSLQQKAATIAGADKIVNQLEVAPAKSN
jgi:hyperosmotically inducible protein